LLVFVPFKEDPVVEFSSYTELKLIEGLEHQKIQKFSDLYDLYSAPLYGIISSITEDADLSNIVLWDVFSVLWKELEKFENEKCRLFTFLRQVAIEKAIDSIRSRSFMIPFRQRAITTTSVQFPRSFSLHGQKKEQLNLLSTID
jgi:RNA polymerase sigma-70 factor (ECF subfamily)